MTKKEYPSLQTPKGQNDGQLPSLKEDKSFRNEMNNQSTPPAAPAVKNTKQPSSFDLWMDRNNPFSKLDAMLPPPKAKTMKIILAFAFVEFLLALANTITSSGCFNISFFGFFNLVTLVLPLFEFIVEPKLHVAFLGAYLFLLLIQLFSKIGKCNIVFTILEMMVVVGMIYLLSVLDPTIGVKAKQFLNNCLCSAPPKENVEEGRSAPPPPQQRKPSRISEGSEIARMESGASNDTSNRGSRRTTRSLIDSIRWQPEFVISSNGEEKELKI